MEAASFGKKIGTGLVRPCHYEVLEINSVSLRGFIFVADAGKRCGR